MTMKLIGLDAASQRSNFGYAIGNLHSDSITIQRAGLLSEPDALDRIAREMRDADRALIAIDAPLGWPRKFGAALAFHSAGCAIEVDKPDFFKRLTDKKLADRLRQHPLEVAADKIARASHTALEVLHQLRSLTNLPLDLVWDPGFFGAGTIEVYPAATLRAHGLRHSGYKSAEQSDVRREICRGLSARIEKLNEYVGYQADAFDACLCVVAAHDFLRGTCVGPESGELEIARVEGWIWAASDQDPGQTART